MDDAVREYLARIGRKGGQRSRRSLSPDAARAMVRVREARRAYRDYFAQCFWWCDPEYRVTSDDVAWVAEQLRRHGDDRAWLIAERLCR